MSNKKKIFLRILKEIGRIFFVAVLSLLFACVIYTLCGSFSTPRCHGCSNMIYCFNFTRKAIYATLLILAIALISLTYYKKISKMWIVACICSALGVFIVGQIVNYATGTNQQTDTLRDYLEVPLDKTN